MSSHYKEKFTQSVRGRVKISVDAANLEKSVKAMYVLDKDIPDNLKNCEAAELCWRVDYKLLPVASQYFDIIDFRHEILKVDKREKQKTPPKRGLAVDIK